MRNFIRNRMPVLLKRKYKSFSSAYLSSDTRSVSTTSSLLSASASSTDMNDNETLNNTSNSKRMNKKNNVDNTENMSMNNVKNKLAIAAIMRVPHYGWTQDAITAAALEDPKLSSSMSGMLTPSELVSWFMDDMNHQLRQKKEKKGLETKENHNYDRDRDMDSSNNNGSDNCDDDDDDYVDDVFNAIQWRLKQVLPLVKSGQWHRGIAMGLSTPLTTQSQLREFVEIIAPKNSTTIYKLLLGGIFVSTELFFLNDQSPNYSDTWLFLRHRLNELDLHENNFGGNNVDLSQLMLKNPLSSMLLDLTNKNDNIGITASLAVGRSLLEGAASLVLPESFRLLQKQQQQQQQQQHGTNPRDYETPPS